MARTAVVAGTATAVSNRVARRQASRWAQEDQSAQVQPHIAAPRYVAPAIVSAAAPAATDTDDMLAQLRQLASLRDEGILTDEEFAAQKARILTS
jgi:hypothetical protein